MLNMNETMGDHIARVDAKRKNPQSFYVSPADKAKRAFELEQYIEPTMYIVKNDHRLRHDPSCPLYGTHAGNFWFCDCNYEKGVERDERVRQVAETIQARAHGPMIVQEVK